MSELAIGDAVVFTKNGKIVDGKIIGLKDNSVIVEYGKRNKKVELKYDEVTQTQS
ncbi:DUF2187 domain-containing protein [Aequorivita lipolytica]|uniref:DUF2187 domain-containing protein n=1 Tax=Aequorivita lipolytica TaxID=153267 RepID=A0A5C6YVB4_9FLAO|nr:DUF2187 domain-containing protein [Aequorivita lipolytica]